LFLWLLSCLSTAVVNHLVTHGGETRDHGGDENDGNDSDEGQKEEDP
jgi:hypothetical protein